MTLNRELDKISKRISIPVSAGTHEYKLRKLYHTYPKWIAARIITEKDRN